ncbi:MAG TPA: ATP-binding protein [Longimicrobiales bacterium]|nr:ATP-binding protein [Longimicrobiales bacterium]
MHTHTTGPSDFLAEASEAPPASYGFGDTLIEVASLALPYLGSWCIVDVIEPDGSPRRLGIVHPDEERQEHARRLEARWPPERDAPFGVPHAARTRHADVISRVTDDMLASFAQSEENLRDLRALSIGSFLTVPLIAHDEVLGAVTYVSAEAGHPHDAGHVALAEAVASCCATALYNERLASLVEQARETSAEMNEKLVQASLRDQELAEAALGASKAKSRFLAAMSHEFRTPLAAIGIFSSLIDEVGQVTDRQRDYLRSIAAATQHLSGLLTDILDLARVEAGQVEIHSRPGSVTEPIADAIAIVEAEAAAAGLVLWRGSPSAAPVRYEGDADRVRQILLNLLANAVHFTPRGGRVGVTWGASATPDEGARLHGRGPWVFVTVQDTGAGIGPKEATEIFEAFAQGRAGRAWRGRGTGLGLTISRQLARRMNGDLTLRSAEGEGSSFTLWLPAAATH